jgi:uncharacterized glyoxalase superfamily protein PhnB
LGSLAKISSLLWLLFSQGARKWFSIKRWAVGAKRPVADQLYGDRMGGVEDPFSYTWWIARHREDLSSEEMQKRAAAAAAL